MCVQERLLRRDLASAFLHNRSSLSVCLRLSLVRGVILIVLSLLVVAASWADVLRRIPRQATSMYPGESFQRDKKVYIFFFTLLLILIVASISCQPSSLFLFRYRYQIISILGIIYILMQLLRINSINILKILEIIYYTVMSNVLRNNRNNFDLLTILENFIS